MLAVEDVEVDVPANASVVSFEGDVVVALLVFAATALTFPPPFLEEGWSKNRPWKMGSMVTLNVRSVSSARGIIWSLHPHLQKWGASMFLSTIFDLLPAVESIVVLAGELVGKKDILQKDSTSSGNLANPRPEFLKMQVLESQRHHPSPKSLVGSAVMQNAQCVCVHPEQNTLGRCTEDDDVADGNFSVVFSIVAVGARTMPLDPSTLGIFGSEARDDDEPMKGCEKILLVDALLDATTVPDEEEDIADGAVVVNVLNDEDDMVVNTKFL